MEFSVFHPYDPTIGGVQVLFWLSGLTCTWANFTEKAGAQCYAASEGLILVCPDTSPRGTDLRRALIVRLGLGRRLLRRCDAGRRELHYRMHSYVTRELYPN